MTFEQKTGIGSGSPSFTPTRQKQLQSERNEDSAPQHFDQLPALQVDAGLAIGASSDAIRVPLKCGLVALVDAADAVRVLALAWHATSKASAPGVFYVHHTLRRTPGRKGKKGSLSLHRFVMGCELGDGKVVDHINGDTLDNRRANLRITDSRGNATNVTRSKRQKLGGYKGVSWHPKAQKWQAQICAGDVRPNGKRKQLYLGLFDDPVEAAKAYDREALLRFGEFRCLNFPDGWLGPQEPPVVAADFRFLQSEVRGNLVVLLERDRDTAFTPAACRAFAHRLAGLADFAEGVPGSTLGEAELRARLVLLGDAVDRLDNGGRVSDLMVLVRQLTAEVRR
jgi:hypothetical protein